MHFMHGFFNDELHRCKRSNPNQNLHEPTLYTIYLSYHRNTCIEILIKCVSRVSSISCNKNPRLISLIWYSWNNDIHSQINLIVICAVLTLLPSYQQKVWTWLYLIFILIYAIRSLYCNYRRNDNGTYGILLASYIMCIVTNIISWMILSKKIL